MKSKGISHYLINPFTRIAGFQALLAGLLIWTITTFIGQHNGLVFDSVFGAHFSLFSVGQAFIIHLIPLICLILVMWLAGKLFSKSSIRLIDVAGTITLARAPLLLVAVIGFLPAVKTSINELSIMLSTMSFSMLKLSGLLIFFLVYLLCIIWCVALAYNAFKVSCNVNKKNTVVFIATIIVAEILSVILNFITIKKFFAITALSCTTLIASAGLNPEDYKVVNEIAVQVSDAIQQKNYDKAVVFFDKKMAEALSESNLKLTMEQLESQLGIFQEAKINEITNQEVKGFKAVFIPCQFEKSKLSLQLFFNDKNQISGMYGSPAKVVGLGINLS